MSLSVCFILGALGPSGGVGAVLEHARGLARDHAMEVSIAVWERADGPDPAPGVRLVTVEEAAGRQWDVAVATWWRTAYSLFSIPARRHVYFVQQFEERVYRPGEVERFGAAATHDLPVAFVTEAAWIAELLGDLRPEAPCFHVPNGIDKGAFSPPQLLGDQEAPLRVLVEGGAGLWFKGVQDALAVLEQTAAPLHTTLVAPEEPDERTRAAFDRVLGLLPHAAMPDVYREADILLKLSRVEGVFTPPLEAFHCGATCVVWPVTGHDEYVRHAVNGVVADFDDVPGTASWIDLLARDRALLDRLCDGALETASRWPSWEASTAALAKALERIVEGPPPAAGDGAALLLADLDAAMEEQRLAQRRLMRDVVAAERRLELESRPAWRARRRLGRLLGPRRR
jgi:glycosyltransferase involved in cell wall biosynthesis